MSLRPWLSIGWQTLLYQIEDSGGNTAMGCNCLGPRPPMEASRLASGRNGGYMKRMATPERRMPRLFVASPLEAGLVLELERSQANYLVNVLRLPPAASVLAFNGHDGEWRAELCRDGGRRIGLAIRERARDQTAPNDLLYAFAPLKRARLDYMVQKAVEMGVSRLDPVFTHHTQPQRINLARMRANAVEAAEQCGVLAVPKIAEPVALDRLLAEWTRERLLVFCDEDAEPSDPVATLAAAVVTTPSPPPIGVLIGPEGGFAEAERAALLSLPRVARLRLGPRILRADTAAMAALALVQAVLGDWRPRADRAAP
jgi:16S rRNA (uracil1498-N3)-methyltransferase